MKKVIGPFVFEETQDDGTPNDTISTVFGISDSAFNLLIKLMATHLFKGMILKRINTKTEAFADFVEKNPDIMEKFTTPNDYLVLGLAFARAMHFMKQFEEFAIKAVKSGKSPEEILQSFKMTHEESEESPGEEVKDLVKKKLKALGMDVPVEEGFIRANSAEDAADQVVAKIVAEKAKHIKKDAKEKTVN